MRIALEISRCTSEMEILALKLWRKQVLQVSSVLEKTLSLFRLTVDGT